MTNFPENNTIVDTYRIIKEIGRGGMARIFEAEHIVTKERCALKILAPSDEAYLLSERFLQEFKALSRLKHPNVLTVYECGTFQNRPYFSMELLHGVTLKDAIPDWMRIPSTERFARARHVLLQVTAALDHIHQHGWIHRDVTPANIIGGKEPQQTQAFLIALAQASTENLAWSANAVKRVVGGEDQAGLPPPSSPYIHKGGGPKATSAGTTNKAPAAPSAALADGCAAAADIEDA